MVNTYQKEKKTDYSIYLEAKTRRLKAIISGTIKEGSSTDLKLKAIILCYQFKAKQSSYVLG